MQQSIHATITRIIPLTNSVLQVFLQLSAPLKYEAGQYLEVITQSGHRVPFSIANAPLGTDQLELHIRHTPENKVNSEIITEIQTRGALSIIGPFGQCTHLSLKPNCPIIFMARGSGFAPIKAIIEHFLTSGTATPMHLYWGARSIGDQYLDLPKSWAEHVEYFQYTPIFCPDTIGTPPPEKWTGRSGDLIDTIVQDHCPNLAKYQVLAAGPFDMIFKARHIFTQQGLKLENMYSDAFAFETGEEL